MILSILNIYRSIGYNHGIGKMKNLDNNTMQDIMIICGGKSAKCDILLNYQNCGNMLAIAIWNFIGGDLR
jgi:hypothetical protein